MIRLGKVARTKRLFGKFSKSEIGAVFLPTRAQILHRRFLSGKLDKASLKVQHTPPKVVRSLLVGSSVGLATPAFVIAAVFQAWWKVAPKFREINQVSCRLLIKEEVSNL